MTMRKKFAAEIEAQLGRPLKPGEDPNLMLLVRHILDNLEQQLAKKSKGWGRGQTIVFSMLTDGFSPELVKRGYTKRALELLLDRTRFRIRILTKNSVVGSQEWIDFLAQHKHRFVVGLSTGTLDNAWARRVELGTPMPSARITALHALQSAGVPNFAMLCPIFPHVLAGDHLERLVAAIRPEHVEHIWAEPFNDRRNWTDVVKGLEPGSIDHDYLIQIYGRRQRKLWSRYATNLYTRLRDKAEEGGYLHKLRFLQYEGNVDKADAHHYEGFRGVLLQGKPGRDGRSTNPHIAALQTTDVNDKFSLATEVSNER